MQRLAVTSGPLRPLNIVEATQASLCGNLFISAHLYVRQIKADLRWALLGCAEVSEADLTDAKGVIEE